MYLQKEIQMDIKKLRKQNDWTVEDVASKIGVSAITVYRWESGKSKPHRIFQKKLEEIFGEK